MAAYAIPYDLSQIIGAPGPVVNVRDYGCRGDGVTDDLAAFRLAASAAMSTSRRLYLPKGTYYLNFNADQTTPASWVDITGDLEIFGDGVKATKIKTTDSPPATKGYKLFNLQDNVHLTVRDMELAGPSTIDYSTNPYTNGKGGAYNAPTYAVYTGDQSVDGFARFDRVNFTGKWFNTISIGPGVGRGRFDLVLHDCDVYGYAQAVAVFSDFGKVNVPGPVDRSFFATDCRFPSSGIPAAPPEGDGVNKFGHTLYIHPDVQVDMRNCRFDAANRYAVHFHSGGGKYQRPRFQRFVGCYFGPGIVDGLLLSESGNTDMIECKFYNDGVITCNVEARFIDCDFDFLSSTTHVNTGSGTNPNVLFDACRFGRYGWVAASSGTWTFTGCYGFQGGNVPLAPTDVLANRPSAASVGAGALFFAVDTNLLYTSDGTNWSTVLSGTSPIVNTGATIQVNGGLWRGAPGASPVNSIVQHTSGKTYVRGAVFTGLFASNTAAIAVKPAASGTVRVNECIFDLSGGAAITTLADSPAGILRGSGNTFTNCLPSATTVEQYLSGRPGISPTPVASGASISPDVLNYEVHHVTGTTPIATITPNGNAAAAKAFGGRIGLIADAGWALLASGNIMPAHLNGRNAGELVILHYDPATGKWYEPAVGGGGGGGGGGIPGNPSGILNGNGTGGATTAVPGVDYLAAGAAPSYSGYTSNWYYPVLSSGTTMTTSTISNGTLVLQPWCVARPVTISLLAVAVTVAGQSGSTLRLAVYSDNGHMFPGTLLVDAGTVAADVVAASGVSVAVSATFQPGTYWIGGLCLTGGSPAPTFTSMSGNNGLIGHSNLAGIATAAPAYNQGGLSALPATFAGTGTNFGIAPRVFFRAV